MNELGSRLDALKDEELQELWKFVSRHLDATRPKHPRRLDVYPCTDEGDVGVVAEFVGVDLLPARRGKPEFGVAFWGTLRRATDGRVVVGELSIEPLDAWRDLGVTSEMLRGVSPPQIIAAARPALANGLELLELAETFGWHHSSPDDKRRSRDALAAIPEVPPTHRGGRRRLPDVFYKSIALEYRALYAAGWTKGIRGEMAQKHGVAVSTVRTWIARARELEYLGPARQGAVSADPGRNLALGPDAKHDLS